MRKSIALLGVAGALALAGCGGNGVTDTDSQGRSVITQPVTQAQDAVARQNQQLQQMEQQAAQDEPTVLSP